MRTETTTMTVPFKTTVFFCDVAGCTFKTENQREADEHYGKRHAVAAFFLFGEKHTFMLFKNESDLVAWRGPHRRDPVWIGPGWYVESTWEGPCGRGCCQRDYSEVVSAKSFLSNWNIEAEEARRELGEALEFLVPENTCLLSMTTVYDDGEREGCDDVA